MLDPLAILLLPVAFGLALALTFHGWPKLFEVHIHKHYHGQQDGGKGD